MRTFFTQISLHMLKSRRRRVSTSQITGFSVFLGRVNDNQLTKMRMKTLRNLGHNLQTLTWYIPPSEHKELSSP
jgi:lipoate synthase